MREACTVQEGPSSLRASHSKTLVARMCRWGEDLAALKRKVWSASSPPPMAVPEGGVHCQHPPRVRVHAAPNDLRTQAVVETIKISANCSLRL